MFKIRSLKASLVAGAAFLVAPPLWAQPAQSDGASSEEAKEIIVTGSRIRGANVVGSAVISVDRNLITDTGASTAAELMRQVPQVINLGADESHRGVQGGQGNTTLASGVNLRGIGANTTLLLINGRRTVPSGSRGIYFDPSVLPTIAIERVEVIPDGASALYGSDAIAGVVNFIPRTRFKGFEANVQYGLADQYRKYSGALLGGVAWTGGNAVVAFEYTGHTALRGEDRDFYSSDLRARGGGDYRATLCNPGTLTVGGVNYALGTGTLVANTQNRCDDAKNTDLIPRQDRYSTSFALRQEVGSYVEVFADGFWSRRDYVMRGLLKNSVATAALTVPRSNAYFVSPSPTATSVVVNYRFPTEYGISFEDGFSEVSQLTAGGTVKLGKWKATATAGRGRNHDLFRDNNLINTSLLTAALSSSNPATALNPFVSGLGQPASVYDSFRSYSTNDTYNRRDVYSVNADGPLFSLPGGAVRLAVGAEHMKDEIQSFTLSANAVRAESKQGRKVDSVYAELFIPLFSAENAVPGLRALDLSVAGRYDRYNDVGKTTNPKVGVNWSPIEGLNLKGSYGTSFRAPNLGDINPVPLNVFQRQLVDPSVPGGLSTGLLYSGGNADLKPETATTWSVGAELAPAAVPGLRLKVNRFNVDYRNQVVSLFGLANVLLQNGYYAGYIKRNPTAAEINAFIAAGTPNGVLTPAVVTFLGFTQSQNLGVTIARGFDYEASWHGRVGRGELEIGAFATHFTKYATAPAANAPQVDQLNLINNPPKFRGQNRVIYRQRGFQLGVYHNWIGKYVNDTVASRPRVPSYHTFDGVVTVDLPGRLEGMSVTLNASNLFDRKPPFVDISGGYDAQVSSPIGRTFALTLRGRW